MTRCAAIQHTSHPLTHIHTNKHTDTHTHTYIHTAHECPQGFSNVYFLWGLIAVVWVSLL